MHDKQSVNTIYNIILSHSPVRNLVRPRNVRRRLIAASFENIVPVDGGGYFQNLENTNQYEQHHNCAYFATVDVLGVLSNKKLTSSFQDNASRRGWNENDNRNLQYKACMFHAQSRLPKPCEYNQSFITDTAR